MLKKWNELKDQPITWGGYLKLCGYSTLISVAYTAAYLGVIYKDEIAEKIDEFRNR